MTTMRERVEIYYGQVSNQHGANCGLKTTPT